MFRLFVEILVSNLFNFSSNPVNMSKPSISSLFIYPRLSNKDSSSVFLTNKSWLIWFNVFTSLSNICILFNKADSLSGFWDLINFNTAANISFLNFSNFTLSQQSQSHPCLWWLCLLFDSISPNSNGSQFIPFQ